MKYSQLFSCKDKVALVTGGCGLLGGEICKALGELGATVYSADTDEERLRECDTLGLRPLFLDITSEDSVQRAIELVVAEAGAIDVLVNCAYPRTRDWGLKFESVPFGSWKANIDSHLGGYFLCTRTAAEHMARQSRGSIINFASIYGVVGPDFSIYEGTEMTMPVAYAAIKGGIIALTRYVAAYYGKFNVRANAVSPGGVFDHQPESFVEKYSGRTPLGRMCLPREIVGTVIFLASEASNYITGQNILVDGGWTAW
jgi:NAD(P)-dependent dehydrogenase (short-subunit alcohol dehydrogenase family)